MLGQSECMLFAKDGGMTKPCSALPARCAHVFITLGLVESSAWHPVFKEDMKYTA